MCIRDSTRSSPIPHPHSSWTSTTTKLQPVSIDSTHHWSTSAHQPDHLDTALHPITSHLPHRSHRLHIIGDHRQNNHRDGSFVRKISATSRQTLTITHLSMHTSINQVQYYPVWSIQTSSSMLKSFCRRLLDTLPVPGTVYFWCAQKLRLSRDKHIYISCVEITVRSCESDNPQ